VRCKRFGMEVDSCGAHQRKGEVVKSFIKDHSTVELVTR
jgi:hypothetical protein